MKKLRIFVICVLTVLCMPLVVQAATIDINLKADTQNYESTEDNNIIIVTLELGEFVNITEGEPLRLYWNN